MISYRRSVTVAVPAETAFDFVVDPSKLSQWSPEVVASTVVGGGEVGVGTVLRQTRRQGKREMSSDVAVIVHDRPARHTVRTKVFGVEATFAFSFASRGEQTDVTMEATVVGRWLGRLFEGPMARLMEKADDQALQRLKDALEKG